MGTAHTTIAHCLLDEIKTLPIKLERVSDFGDGTYLILLKCSGLPPGYHGQQEIVLHRDPSGKIEKHSFKPDRDV